MVNSDSSRPNSADARLAAHARAAHLVGLPWPERLRTVQEDRSFSVPSFIELAIGLAREIGTPPVQREQWALLGVEAARRGGSWRVEELEPLAWANLGSTNRIRDRLWASRSAFMRCAGLRHRLGDLLELAETCALEASYWWAIWDVEKATELIDEALRLATSHAEDSVVARYEIQAGMIAAEASRWSVAITMFLSALDRIDPTVYPKLALDAGHNLVWSTIGVGHLDTAMCAILKLSSSYDQFADGKLLLKRDCLIAAIADRRDHWREAELRLHALVKGYLELHLPAQAADMELELARLAMKRERWSEATHFAARAVRGFSAAGSPHEAAAATRLFRHVARKCRGNEAAGVWPAAVKRSPGADDE